jgi:hypothetical protein
MAYEPKAKLLARQGNTSTATFTQGMTAPTRKRPDAAAG